MHLFIIVLLIFTTLFAEENQSLGIGIIKSQNGYDFIVRGGYYKYIVPFSTKQTYSIKINNNPHCIEIEGVGVNHFYTYLQNIELIFNDLDLSYPIVYFGKITSIYDILLLSQILKYSYTDDIVTINNNGLIRSLITNRTYVNLDNYSCNWIYCPKNPWSEIMHIRNSLRIVSTENCYQYPYILK